MTRNSPQGKHSEMGGLGVIIDSQHGLILTKTVNLKVLLTIQFELD